MLSVNIKTGNAAFEDYEVEECVRILKEVCNKLESGYTYGSCIDINGNKVGEWELK